jgi:hypothetical protein
MTTTFGGVEIKEAGEITVSYQTRTREAITHGGKSNVQTSTQYGTLLSLEGMGTQADVDALVAMIGAIDTLITDDATYTNMAIQGDIKTKKAAPGNQYYTVTFIRKTTS